ncbi:MAG: tRNA (cytidine(34)-2'-O)-methyltransferase [Defluviitaleaceae bacterium]|nr:tRNA (cytidine(34)-2'-O)-methyltransferase [Defluviitaleaceae bacterium]
MNIVLHQPEIPHNTGAIGRTCLVTGAKLHLIRPYGFYLDEKSLKRAGMDYWHKIHVCEYDNFAHFMDSISGGGASCPSHVSPRIHLIETAGDKIYTNVKYNPNDYIIFGSETAGLPASLLSEYPGRIAAIPMTVDMRSLNLSVAVGIVLYEALRQNGFPGLQ